MRKRILSTILVLALFIAAITVGPIYAQTDDTEISDTWQFAGAVYLWGAGIDGKTQSGTEVSVDFGDLVDNLEMGFMGAFEARKGKWMFLTDVIYLDIGANKSVDVSIPIGPGAIDVTTNSSSSTYPLPPSRLSKGR